MVSAALFSMILFYLGLNVKQIFTIVSCLNALLFSYYIFLNPRPFYLTFFNLVMRIFYHIEIEGEENAGIMFIDALNMLKRLVNIDDAKTLPCHSVSITHRHLSNEELKHAGVTPDLMRISVGIEHVSDIIANIDQALSAAKTSQQIT